MIRQVRRNICLDSGPLVKKLRRGQFRKVHLDVKGTKLRSKINAPPLPNDNCSGGAANKKKVLLTVGSIARPAPLTPPLGNVMSSNGHRKAYLTEIPQRGAVPKV